MINGEGQLIWYEDPRRLACGRLYDYSMYLWDC